MPGQLVPPVPVAKTKYPVRIFSANPIYGNHKFTRTDLEKVVANFNSYQRPRLAGYPHPQAFALSDFEMPVVEVGHDADQLIGRAISSRSDLPSCGEPTRLWMQGPDMFAELDGVPVELASMANAGQFKHVSATIYPNYRTPDGKYHGPMLRGVSLLGFEQPKLKGMGRLSPFVFSDRGYSGEPGGQQLVAVFSEGPFMDESGAMELLKKFFPAADFAGIPPAFLIMVATQLQQMTPADLVGTGSGTGSAVDNGMSPMTPAMFSERFGGVIDQRLTLALAPILKQLTDNQTALAGRVQSHLETAERQEVLSFSEQNRDRLYPYELDPKNESYIVSRLLALPAPNRVAEMKAVVSRPKYKSFSESMPDPIEGGVEGGHGKIVGSGGDSITQQRKTSLLAMSGTGRAIVASERAAARTAARNPSAN